MLTAFMMSHSVRKTLHSIFVTSKCDESTEHEGKMIDILRDESDTGAQGQRMGSMVYDVLRERMIRGSYPPGHKFTVRG